jgi:hypothetical protein
MRSEYIVWTAEACTLYTMFPAIMDSFDETGAVQSNLLTTMLISRISLWVDRSTRSFGGAERRLVFSRKDEETKFVCQGISTTANHGRANKILLGKHRK